MKIEKKSLTAVYGFAGSWALTTSKGIIAMWEVDDRITVFQKKDGHYSFKDKETGKRPPKKIIDEIKKLLPQ